MASEIRAISYTHASEHFLGIRSVTVRIMLIVRIGVYLLRLYLCTQSNRYNKGCLDEHVRWRG